MQVALAVVVMNRLGHIAACLLWLIAGCSISPVPEPPVTQPTLDGRVDIGSCATCDGPLFLQGGPGAVGDATTIWAVDLDQTTAPAFAGVASDGSYKLYMDGNVGDEIRLQARRGELRSTPVDIVVGNDSPLALAPRPLADCFKVITDLVFGSQLAGAKTSRAIVLTQTCGAPLTLSRIALRVASSAFILTAPATPVALESGAELTVEVSYTAQPGAVDEEILLVETSAPSKDRRAIALAGNASP
jgi:hypothetical protein